jgi:hypothetical protein
MYIFSTWVVGWTDSAQKRHGARSAVSVGVREAKEVPGAAGVASTGREGFDFGTLYEMAGSWANANTRNIFLFYFWAWKFCSFFCCLLYPPLAH